MILVLILAVGVISIPCLVALVMYFRHLDRSTELAEIRKDYRLSQERVDRLTESLATKGGYDLILPQPVSDRPLEKIPGYFTRKKRLPPVQVTIPNSEENTQ